MNFKKPFFIAEISANHEGSISKAYSLIKLAKKYGADAVKLQTYKPETMTLNSKKRYFKINNGLWKNYYLWDLYKKAQTPFKWQNGGSLKPFGKKTGQQNKDAGDAECATEHEKSNDQYR